MSKEWYLILMTARNYDRIHKYDKFYLLFGMWYDKTVDLFITFKTNMYFILKEV